MLEELPLRRGSGIRGWWIDLNRLACVTSLKPSSLCLPQPTLHRLRTGYSGLRTRQAKSLAYGPRQAAYDLKKLRGNRSSAGSARPVATNRSPPVCGRSQPCSFSRDKAIKPVLAAAQDMTPSHGGQNPRAIDRHYHDLRLAMQGVFHELGIAA